MGLSDWLETPGRVDLVKCQVHRKTRNAIASAADHCLPQNLLESGPGDSIYRLRVPGKNTACCMTLAFLQKIGRPQTQLKL